MSASDQTLASTDAAVWVVAKDVSRGTFERLGDARRLADELRCSVGVISASGPAEDLIPAGSDLVVRLQPATFGGESLLTAIRSILQQYTSRLVLTGFDPDSRALAATLAASNDWLLVSPVLLMRVERGRLKITLVDHSRRQARQIVPANDRPVVITMRDGVGVPAPLDSRRNGTIVDFAVAEHRERVVRRRRILQDPSTADIRHLGRLVAGGRGVGGREGFDRLRRIASLLEAGVAASRMAVDLGWIEYERQVGQTGKTVRPALYLACGISGAVHHLEGMSESEHIVAINSDRDAPLLQRAQLALVADLHQVLDHFELTLNAHR